jgi:hypothetical protein
MRIRPKCATNTKLPNPARAVPFSSLGGLRALWVSSGWSSRISKIGPKTVSFGPLSRLGKLIETYGRFRARQHPSTTCPPQPKWRRINHARSVLDDVFLLALDLALKLAQFLSQKSTSKTAPLGGAPSVSLTCVVMQRGHRAGNTVFEVVPGEARCSERRLG